MNGQQLSFVIQAISQILGALGTGPSSKPVILWTSWVSALQATYFRPDQMTLPMHMMHILELVIIWKFPLMEKSKVLRVFCASIIAIISAWAAELDSGTTRLTPQETSLSVFMSKMAAEKGPPLLFIIFSLASPSTKLILSSSDLNSVLLSFRCSWIQSGRGRLHFIYLYLYQIGIRNRIYLLNC